MTAVSGEEILDETPNRPDTVPAAPTMIRVSSR